MGLVRRIRNLCRFLLRREELERELEDEFRSYLDMAVEESTGKGVSREEAIRVARLKLGGLEQLKEVDRSARIGSGLDCILGDLRYAFRTLKNNPRFTAVTVIILALGIGASTVVFSVVNAVLLSPLPYNNSDRLVWLWSVDPNGPLRTRVSYPDFLDWRAQSQTLDLVGFGGNEIVLTGVGEPQRLYASFVLGDLTALLGVPPLLGTTGLEAEGTPQEPVVLLSHELWQRSFGSDPNVLGRQITLSELRYAVAGVMPSDSSSQAHS